MYHLIILSLISIESANALFLKVFTAMNTMKRGMSPVNIVREQIIHYQIVGVAAIADSIAFIKLAWKVMLR